MNSQNYTDDLLSELYNIADVYVRGTLKDVLFEGVDASIRHDIHHYWGQNPQVGSTYTVLQTESLLSIPECAENTPNNSQGN